MFSEFYKSSSRKSLETDAFNYLVSDMLRDKLVGAGKAQTLTAMNMEQASPARFLPSMFYTFMYVSDIMETIGETNFYDRVPLILCTSFDGKTVSGINFNMIPNDVRASVLDLICEGYSEFYENIGGSTLKINEPFARMLIDPSACSSFMKILENKTGVNISGAFRQYNIKYVMLTRMIEYDMWKYIPFLSFKDAVRGANLAAIQASVIKNK